MHMLKESYTYREIHEQPEVIERLLKNQRKTIEELARAIQSSGVDHAVIAARGTSDNAGRYAQYLLGANGLSVGLATPSLFSIYQRPPRFGKALVMGISQSGKSPDIVAVLAEARRQGALTAAITNEPESDLAGYGDIVIDLEAGPERAVAATKTYTAELGAIALLGAFLAGDAQMFDALQGIPQAMAATLKMDETIAQIAPRYRYMERSVVIGRGYNYATAFELALKMKELTYSIVEPYSSADFLHGPLAMIEHGFPVILIAPGGKMQPGMQELVLTLSEREAEIISISDDPAILSRSRIPLALPVSVPEWLSPMTSILPGQLLAMHIADVRDYDVDSPRGLTKVTETR
jgi:glucosamine--fructose-6-phosphate aminotransferase (isomerizing)